MVVGALDAPLPGRVARHRRGDAAPFRGADRGGARERAAAEAGDGHAAWRQVEDIEDSWYDDAVA